MEEYQSVQVPMRSKMRALEDEGNGDVILDATWGNLEGVSSRCLVIASFVGGCAGPLAMFNYCTIIVLHKYHKSLAIIYHNRHHDLEFLNAHPPSFPQ